ncbi:DUF3027 domain-containing protein [Nocardia sp. NPDC049149]|uniref:DUF3027 domain-containing protein n=1 Tax=Nocardia sp. NPDC049149 TaxID=3364315 RepID=UPI003724453D
MSAVSVSESGVRPLLADAVDLARRALLELEPAGVGAHLGVAAEDDSAATHRFEATLAGYRGWQWAVVVAAPPEADYATVSESALLPGPDALVAPDFVPWDQRVRPGDLAPGDLLAPPPNDPRLVPGYIATGDPVVDEVAYEVGLGRTQVLSLEGREEAAERWHAEYGPETEMAKAAPSTCGLCGFYLPLAGSLRAAFGVCGNAMGADGRVVHAAYGCGAHSDTVAPTGGGSPLYEAFDDAAVEFIPTADITAPEPKVDAAEAAATDAASDAGAPVAEVKSADAVAEVAPEAAEATVAEAGSTTPVAEVVADAAAAEVPVTDAGSAAPVGEVSADVVSVEAPEVAVAEVAAPVEVAPAAEESVVAAESVSDVDGAVVAGADAAPVADAEVTESVAAPDAAAEPAVVAELAVADFDASAVESSVGVDADDAQAADAPVPGGDSADAAAVLSAGAESSDSVTASGFGAAPVDESTEAGAPAVDSAASAGVDGSDVAVSADVEQAAEDAAQAPADVSVEGVTESRAVESSPEN